MWIKVNNTTTEVIATCVNEITAEAGYSIFDIDDSNMPNDLMNPAYGFAQYCFIEDGYGSGVFQKYSGGDIDDMEESCENDSCEKEVFIQSSRETDGWWSGIKIEATSNGQLSFLVPIDFAHLHKLSAIGYPSTNGTEKNIKLYSQYGGIGQAKNATQESELTGTYNFTTDVFFEIDLMPVFSSLIAGDLFTIHIVHNNIGATILYTGIQMLYHSQ